MHRHTFIRATHFSRFIPLSPLAILLWIWYFLISTRSRVLALLHTAISLIRRRVSFRPLISHRCCLSLSFLQPHSFLSSLSLLCQSSSHFFVFISCSSLWRAPFSLLFVLLLYCASSPLAPLSIIISSLAFSTLYLLTRGLHCVFSTPSISSIHTATRTPRWIFIFCVLLVYDGLRT